LYVCSIRAGDVERGREREELYNEVYLLAVTRRGAALAHLFGFFICHLKPSGYEHLRCSVIDIINNIVLHDFI